MPPATAPTRQRRCRLDSCWVWSRKWDGLWWGRVIEFLSNSLVWIFGLGYVSYNKKKQSIYSLPLSSYLLGGWVERKRPAPAVATQWPQQRLNLLASPSMPGGFNPTSAVVSGSTALIHVGANQLRAPPNRPSAIRSTTLRRPCPWWRQQLLLYASNNNRLAFALGPSSDSRKEALLNL